MVTTKAKRAEKEYVMFSVCAPTLTKQKQEVEFAFGVCLTLGFSLSQGPLASFVDHYSNPKHAV